VTAQPEPDHAPEVRTALCAIVADPDYGPTALSDPRLMAGLLSRYLPASCPSSDRELIVAAASAGLADTLREQLARGLEPGAAIRLTAMTFSSDSNMTPAASSWVTREFAIALGVGDGRSLAAPQQRLTRRHDPSWHANFGQPSPPASEHLGTSRGAMWAAHSRHAFLSYVRDDAADVDLIQHRLESASIRVWRDTTSLWPGQDWRVQIRRAIEDNALAFVACFSGNSESRHVSYQNEELVLAIEQLRIRRPDSEWLIPVRLDECEIPDLDIGAGRTLRSIQRVDIFGAQQERALMVLVEAVQRILDPPPDVR
jgi:hypothetical protein